jgi:hypothetical protein
MSEQHLRRGTVTGGATASLTYVVNLATGMEFHVQHSGYSGAGDALFFSS